MSRVWTTGAMIAGLLGRPAAAEPLDQFELDGVRANEDSAPLTPRIGACADERSGFLSKTFTCPYRTQSFLGHEVSAADVQIREWPSGLRVLEGVVMIFPEREYRAVKKKLARIYGEPWWTDEDDGDRVWRLRESKRMSLQQHRPSGDVVLKVWTHDEPLCVEV